MREGCKSSHVSLVTKGKERQREGGPRKKERLSDFSPPGRHNVVKNIELLRHEFKLDIPAGGEGWDFWNLIFRFTKDIRYLISLILPLIVQSSL